MQNISAKPDFFQQKIVVVGAAKSGIACANLLNKLGAKVLVSEIRLESEVIDLKNIGAGIETEFGGHSEKILKYDSLVISPGVHLNIPILKKAKDLNIPMYSELEIAFRLIRPKQVIAVTGTNGKTTTTTLIGAICSRKTKKTGEKVVIGGNIGTPLSQLVEEIDQNTIVVLEVSSYQLELINTFRARIATILNITPDHLERHKFMEEYAKMKSKIFLNQTSQDFSVLNYDDIYCRKIGDSSSGKTIFFSQTENLATGVCYRDGKIRVNLDFNRYEFVLKTNLPGAHNRENILSAITMGILAGADKEDLLETLDTFKGVEHRIEFVAEIKGVKYINDSKATNVDSVKVALESFNQPIVLILGGRDKGSPYTPLQKLVKEKVKYILLIGESAEKIQSELGSYTRTKICYDLPKAIKTAYEIASVGDIVLLSPACASFDQFENYEHRGRIFKELVHQLK